MGGKLSGAVESGDGARWSCLHHRVAGNSQEPRDLWRIEPLSEFSAPATPTKETLRRKFVQMLQRFRPSKRASAAEAAGDLQSAPATVLDRAAPMPALEPFFAAIDAAVEKWLAHPGETKRALVFVLPLHDEFALMAHWAEGRKKKMVRAPSSAAILAKDFAALPEMETEGELLVIPELEDWFLRQHSGLALVRELIARLSKAKARCVIGVNSWAWSFLARAADTNVEMPVPLTLAPFDDKGLCLFLSELAESNRAASVVFRSDSTGDVLFDPAQSCGSNADAPARNGDGKFLKRLAAISRGNPWLAWHIFRSSMRIAAENPDAEKKPAREVSDARETVWINPVAEVALPELPKDVRAAALLVFHALLIHGDLAVAELENVLPPIHTSHVVHRLAADRLLLERNGKWRVAPEAYPAVRDALSHAGYPLDDL